MLSDFLQSYNSYSVEENLAFQQVALGIQRQSEPPPKSHTLHKGQLKSYLNIKYETIKPFFKKQEKTFRIYS